MYVICSHKTRRSLLNIDVQRNTKITEVTLSVFVYRLFRKDITPLGNTDKLTPVILCIKLTIEHFTTCDSRINLNYMMWTEILTVLKQYFEKSYIHICHT